ncbi:hypothetical protein QCA50_001299 [Cerrena zonata]|uniref:Uncharacterized protein n=1 Tax=Cerrena zonata TaxID=2478898 RepID=A0AAW0GVF3_9APHY
MRSDLTVANQITMPSPITFSNAPSFSKTSNSTLATLEASASALEHSLTTLTQRLNLLSQSPAVDPSAIGQTAEAISKVSLALQQVKELHWRENNASAA